MTTPPYESDETLGARLRAELPRHAAPAHVRAAVARASAPARRPTPWLAPVLAAAATALVLGLVFMPMLPRFVHPTEQLVRSVVAEHTRSSAPHRLDAGRARTNVETGDVERAGDPESFGEWRQRRARLLHQDRDAGIVLPGR